MYSKKITFLFTVVLTTLFSLSNYAGISILNGLTHIHKTEKGQTIEGEIIIQNMDKESSELLIISLKDLMIFCKKESSFIDFGAHDRSLGKWITFNTKERILKPKENFILKYTINIPEHMEEEIIDLGTFWGVIMVETSNLIEENDIIGLTVNTKFRYAVQIITHVGEFINPEIEFLDIAYAKTKELEANINITIQNKGDYMVQPSLILELFNAAGENVKQTQATYKKVYPKKCADFSIQISNLPKGVYNGVLIADYGGDMAGANISITID